MTDDLPINPKAPSGSPYSPIVATVARAMATATRPNVDPDAVTAAPRGQLGQRHVWELYAPQAKAALDASHHAELVEALRRARSRMMQLKLTPQIERELDEMALLLSANAWYSQTQLDEIGGEA